jgi:hypothetical protein
MVVDAEAIGIIVAATNYGVPPRFNVGASTATRINTCCAVEDR